MENMPGMEGMVPPPPSSPADHQPQHTMTTSSHMIMTHMTFFWGKNAEILFSGWPGTRTGMYVLALIFVFVLSVIVEWLTHCRRTGGVEGPDSFSGGLIRTVVHGIRIGLGYLVMLAVMSFNVGVLIVAVAGHAVGFFLFGSRVFKKSGDSDKGFGPTGAGC
ncbi:Copper transporter 6 [Sesamum alatum]|uniref:Copper transport protein n=1 Tax=Sesamum alatum TaxID=300844 RepID=A0AAE2D054_9LAMI|nr:Copper transporter 6 [Sesamum alatum]